MKQIVPAGILHNTATGRWHPILYRQAPLPSGSDFDLPAQRFKSIGHHTDGFETLGEAEASLTTWNTERKVLIDVGLRLEWDGVDVPADVTWLSVRELEERAAAIAREGVDLSHARSDARSDQEAGE